MKPEKVVEYSQNGQIIGETWWLNNLRHREDGPAVIQYHKNGQIYYESWRLNDQQYRENGPSFISYYENGQIERESWWLNGKELTKTEFRIRKELKEFDRLLEETLNKIQ